MVFSCIQILVLCFLKSSLCKRNQRKHYIAQTDNRWKVQVFKDTNSPLIDLQIQNNFLKNSKMDIWGTLQADSQLYVKEQKHKYSQDALKKKHKAGEIALPCIKTY